MIALCVSSVFFRRGRRRISHRSNVLDPNGRDSVRIFGKIGDFERCPTRPRNRCRGESILAIEIGGRTASRIPTTRSFERAVSGLAESCPFRSDASGCRSALQYFCRLLAERGKVRRGRSRFRSLFEPRTQRCPPFANGVGTPFSPQLPHFCGPRLTPTPLGCSWRISPCAEEKPPGA